MRFAKPGHPRATGQVERLNRTIREATAPRCRYQATAELNEQRQPPY